MIEYAVVFILIGLLGGKSAIVPPDSIPNSEVKCRSTDGSVRFPHVRVGGCQV